MCALVLIGKSHDTTCSGFDRRGRGRGRDRGVNWDLEPPVSGPCSDRADRARPEPHEIEGTAKLAALGIRTPDVTDKFTPGGKRIKEFDICSFCSFCSLPSLDA